MWHNSAQLIKSAEVAAAKGGGGGGGGGAGLGHCQTEFSGSVKFLCGSLNFTIFKKKCTKIPLTRTPKRNENLSSSSRGLEPDSRLLAVCLFS